MIRMRHFDGKDLNKMIVRNVLLLQRVMHSVGVAAIAAGHPGLWHRRPELYEDGWHW
jgi:hypothetical protein